MPGKNTVVAKNGKKIDDIPVGKLTTKVKWLNYIYVREVCLYVHYLLKIADTVTNLKVIQPFLP